jgi:hypothetical protein
MIVCWRVAYFCSEIKERIKKTKDEKKAKKAETTAKTQKSQSKGNLSKGAAPKGPKIGGGGGKRWAANLDKWNVLSWVLFWLWLSLITSELEQI